MELLTKKDLARLSTKMQDPALSPRATIDFETRSTCNLKQTNSWVYSRDPTTEIMCLAYHIPGDKKIHLWHMAHPSAGVTESDPPDDLFDWIESGGLVEAHNAFFERMIWKHIAHKRMGWPAIDHEQWRCSAAKAAAHSLPRALETVLGVLDLGIEKDMTGNRIMLKLSKPRKARQQERFDWALDNEGKIETLWHEDYEDLKKLWKYCKQDVRGEIAVSKALKDLSPYELKVWQMDQQINERGFWCDIELAETALRLTTRAVVSINGKLDTITNGQVLAASRRAQVRAFVNDECGVNMPNMKAETVEEILDREDLPKLARKVLSLAKSANRTSTRKYKAMTLHACHQDQRIRGGIAYCGAERTGRFSGRGVQPHNFPRGSIKDMDAVCDDILQGDIEWLMTLHSDPMEIMSHALRGAICAGPGLELAVADFAAIEARVVFWLAGAEKALDAFRNGEDIYCDLASVIYKKDVTPDMAAERFLGKQGILGLGFGMGPPKFLVTLRKYKAKFSVKECERLVPEYKRRSKWMLENGKKLYGQRLGHDEKVDWKIDYPELTLCKYVVDTYRERYEEVKELWKVQEEAAIAATREQGVRVHAGLVSWYHDGTFLKCKLPSGRQLHYFRAELKKTRDPWGGFKETLRYFGTNEKTSQKSWISTYGGKIVENIVQAIARDLMVWGMLNVHYCQDLYKLILSVHDELISEKPEGEGSADHFAKLMSTSVPWADGCPVDAKAWVGVRYKKD